MNQQKLLIALNWKSNPATHAEARRLAEDIAGIDAGQNLLVVIPPFPYLAAVRDSLKEKGSSALLGAQDIMPFSADFDRKGSVVLTGEVSADMLRDAGVSHVIIGHSERRWILGESDALINEKLRAAVKTGIEPILCVGEREKTDVPRAVQESVDQLSLAIEGSVSAQYIVAYEPVWAIGGNKTVDPAYASEVIAGIQKYLSTTGSPFPIPVLYGGSVNCENIVSLIQFKNISGFLIGSASLSAKNISCIISKLGT